MAWWAEVGAQFVGSVIAGLVLLPLALWWEARLDEYRELRHEKRLRSYGKRRTRKQG